MFQHRRRAVTTISAATTAAVIAALTGLAFAGVPNPAKGDPQPELAPFNIAPKSEAASTTAMASNGTMLIAYYGSETQTDLCILPRAARKCSHITRINSPGGNTEFGVPQVLASGDKNIALLTYNSVSGELYYFSTDGGASFTGPAGVGGGDFAADESTIAGPSIIFSDNTDHDGLQVAAFTPLSPASMDPVVISTIPAFDTALGTYKGGVILADTPDAHAVSTRVWYAASSSSPYEATSFKVVDTFPNETLLAVSGSALLTVQKNGKEQDEIRFFNGTSYGAAHAVPDFGGTLGHANILIQDSRGNTHVFSEGAPPIKGSHLVDYDLYEQTTRTGSTWSALQNHGNAINWGYYSGALDSNGTGAIVGGEAPMHVWPILQVAHVSFALAHASVKVGHSATATGKGTPAAAGRTVALQRLEGKKWHTIADATETASGKFTFHITEHTAGKYTFRAATDDKAGYVQFGYSSARKLTVHKMKHS